MNCCKNILLLQSLIVCLVLGCKKSNELETAPVSGKVSLDGKPLKKGSVTFMPSRGRTATGEVQADGTFVLQTYDTADGAVIGIHQVGVVERTNQPFDESNPTLATNSLIPKKYFTPEDSGLKFEVKKGQGNVFNIELKTK